MVYTMIIYDGKQHSDWNILDTKCSQPEKNWRPCAAPAQHRTQAHWPGAALAPRRTGPGPTRDGWRPGTASELRGSPRQAWRAAAGVERSVEPAPPSLRGLIVAELSLFASALNFATPPPPPPRSTSPAPARGAAGAVPSRGGGGCSSSSRSAFGGGSSQAASAQCTLIYSKQYITFCLTFIYNI